MKFTTVYLLGATTGAALTLSYLASRAPRATDCYASHEPRLHVNGSVLQPYCNG